MSVGFSRVRRALTEYRAERLKNRLALLDGEAAALRRTPDPETEAGLAAMRRRLEARLRAADEALKRGERSGNT